MKDKLFELIELFKTARPATRITMVLSALAIVGVTMASSWYAGRPDLVQLWSGLSSAEASEYKSALAQSGIAFRSSPPPENGIWVDSSQRSAAEAQVALAGFRPTTKGIQVTDGGIDSAFISARSRNQMADKREWQECEVQLESLGFVERASVCSSSDDHSMFTSSRDRTISVTLGLRNGVLLDDAQARTVATLVRTRFNVPLENITIVDERGNLLHDGADNAKSMSGTDLFAHKRRYDSDAERRANQALEIALGRGMAHVTVNSVWIYDESETIKESALPAESAPFFKSSASVKTNSPKVFSGGEAGVSSNITQEFGVESAGTGNSSSGSAGQESKNEETRSIVGRSTEHTTVKTPRITRMSVALVADETAAANLESLERMVKAAVGFDESRKDAFESFTTKLASIQRDEEGKPIAPAEPEAIAPPNEYLQLAIEHGVELLAAVAFIFVLFKSLRGAKAAKSQANLTSAATTSGGRGGVRATANAKHDRRSSDGIPEEDYSDLDPELLARVQVEELVRTDPERVSEILAQWASSATEKVGA